MMRSRWGAVADVGMVVPMVLVSAGVGGGADYVGLPGVEVAS